MYSEELATCNCPLDNPDNQAPVSLTFEQLGYDPVDTDTPLYLLRLICSRAIRHAADA
ncbi:MAG: hypothetical protein IPH22_10690 [Nitrosomonas sp.]|nr:hypothetical protein [Nitrosomonas sp.]